jgi:hypothetical protein
VAILNNSATAGVVDQSSVPTEKTHDFLDGPAARDPGFIAGVMRSV